MGAPTCPRCGIGLMHDTGLSPSPGVYEHRCEHCGYIEHLRERHAAPTPEAKTSSTNKPPAMTQEQAVTFVLKSLNGRREALVHLGRAIHYQLGSEAVEKAAGEVAFAEQVLEQALTRLKDTF